MSIIATEGAPGTSDKRRARSATCAWRRLVTIAPVLVEATVLGLFLAQASPAAAQTLEEARLADRLAMEAGQRLVNDFEAALNATGPTAAEGRIRAALMITQNPEARLILKADANASLGRAYRTLLVGDGAIFDQVRQRATAILRREYPWIQDRLVFVQNARSTGAPMDGDFGIMTATQAEQEQLLRDLYRANRFGAVDRFHSDLQAALERAFREVGRAHGPDLNPELAFITGTTTFHVEGYRDPRVLQEGGVGGRTWIQNTVDVTKVKIDKAQTNAVDGLTTQGFALREAGRETLKDLDKVERIFDHLKKLTGVAPEWRPEQDAIINILRRLRDMEIGPFEANVAILRITKNQRNLFDACKNLMETAEAAWKLRKVLPQEYLMRLVARYIADADIDATFEAIVAGRLDDLPPSSRAVLDELKLVAFDRMRRLRASDATSLRSAIADLKKIFPKFGLSADDELLVIVLRQLEMGSLPELQVLLGQESARLYAQLYGLKNVARQAKLIGRYDLMGLPSDVVDMRMRDVARIDMERRLADMQKTATEGQLPGKGASVAVYTDALIRAGMAMWQTGEIMDRNLDPAEEARQIDNTWCTALPFFGEIYMGMVMGNEAYWEGDAEKGMKAAIWVAIGATGILVPGGQIPAMLAAMVMMADEATSAVLEVAKEQDLIEAWIASGNWDEKTGILKELGDDRKAMWSLADEDLERTFQRLCADDEAGYRSGLRRRQTKGDVAKSLPDSPTITIRDSIFEYAERIALNHDPRVQPLKKAFASLYPREDFDLDSNLREPVTIGRTLLGARIQEKMGKAVPSVAIHIFNKLKIIYDAEAVRAIAILKSQAEAEYQARNNVGEAKELEAKLKVLGEQLGTPLLDRVNGMFTGLQRYVEKIKNPFLVQSMPRRRLEMLRRYVDGYSRLKSTIEEIRRLFSTAGVNPPTAWGLSGYLEVDQPRITNLKTDYLNAFGEARKDVQALTGAAFDDTNACERALYLKLTAIKLRRLHAVDQKLLMEQWAGNQAAALKRRDAAMQKALDAADATRPIAAKTLSALWDEACREVETAHAWNSMIWDGEWLAGAGAMVSGVEPVRDATATLKEFGRDLDARIASLSREYDKARADGATELAACLGQKGMPPKPVKEPPPPEPGRSGKIEMTASPAEVMATESFTVSAKLPADLAARARSFEWWGSAELLKPGLAARTTAVPEAVMRFGPTVGRTGSAGAFDPNQKVTLRVLDAGNREIGSGEVAVKLKPVAFSASAAGSWEAKTDANGLHLTRKAAKKIAHGADRDYEAAVWARLDIVWASSVPKDDAELKKTLDSIGGGYIRGQNYRVTPGKSETITLAGFKGGFINKTPQLYVEGNPEGLVDLAFPSTTSFVGGIVVKDGIGISFSGSVWGGGYRLGESPNFWLDDSSFASRQGNAAYGEMMAILRSVSLGPDGKVTMLPYTGPALDGLDMPKVTLKAARTKVRAGEAVTVDAIVENAAAEDNPLTYTWTGDHAGQGKQVTFVASAGGKQTLAVAVSGAQGSIGSASLVFDVEDLKVQIAKIEPAASDIPVGGKAVFQATVSAQGGSYVYRWQPSTDVAFDPAEGPAAQTRAVFKRPGRTRIWVEVLRNEGATLSTLGRSENLELNIIEPALSLSAAPDPPMVGQDVRMTVSAGGSTGDMAFRWEVTPNGKILGESPDGREMTFRPLDDKPVTITVRGRARVSGDSLGEAKYAVTARMHAVSVKVLGPIGPAPRIWAKGGLVDATGQIAVFQNVRLQATIEPAPAAIPLRYQWALNEDSHFAGGQTSDIVTVNRSQVGECRAVVEITDAKGTLLGKGSGVFSVAVSQKEINDAGNKAEAGRKLANARQLWRKGDIDAALKELEAAQGLDPQNTEIRDELQKMTKDKAAILALHKQVRDLIDQERFADGHKTLNDAMALNPNYGPSRDLELFMRDKEAAYGTAVEESVGKIDLLTKSRDYEQGLNEIAATRSRFKYLDPYYVDRLRNYENFCRPFVEAKKRTLAAYAEAQALARTYDFEGADAVMAKTLPGFANNFGVSDAATATQIMNFAGDMSQKVKRLAESMAFVAQGVEEAAIANPRKSLLENALKAAQDVLSLQPPNQKAAAARDLISRRLAELNTPVQPPGPAASPFSLGRVWRVKQRIGKETWTWTWTRQGETDAFDALAHNDQNGQESHHAITFVSEKGGQVTLSRPDAYGRYIGTLSPDRTRIVSGIMDSISSSDQNWTATIEGQQARPQPPSSSQFLGRVWRVHEASAGSSFHGVWTRRGSSNVFDAVWEEAPGVTDTITIESVSGNQVTMFRSGNSGRYVGTLSPDRTRVVSGTMSWNSAFNWTAIIEGEERPPVPGPPQGNAARPAPTPGGTPGTSQALGPPSASPSPQTASSPLSLGRVWRVREASAGASYDGVWTRRGSSSVFDAVWKVVGVTDTITIESVSGNQVVLFRSGNSGRYVGTLSPDRTRVVSGTMSWNSAFNWTAIIEGEEKPPVPGPPTGPAGKPVPSAGELPGRWSYHDYSYGFSDVHEFLPGGRMGNDPNGTWVLEGGRLTVRWPNGWVNVYSWDPQGGAWKGVATNTAGTKVDITLVRVTRRP